ncbi:MAG: thiamine pyrophosphate-dependent enzyme, partial [Pseudomonadota bacterium]
MSIEHFLQVEENLRLALEQGTLPDVQRAHNCSQEMLLGIFRAQIISRQCDLQARHMQAQGQGYYTIGSSGHEGMACVAAALRINDMAFLHYRDGAFLAMRALMADYDPIEDILKSVACAKDDPISGGRHKVLGSKPLFIPPQTSTIASHLPKAVGAAFSIGLAGKTRHVNQVLEKDAIILASFGDASLNHASAQTALNCAGWIGHQKLPLPILFVCEDNTIGISTKTPHGWVEANLASRGHIEYFSANGCDVYDCYDAALSAQEYVRKNRAPAILHLKLVRLFGHAGSDVEASYLPAQTITQWQAKDPLLYSASALINSGMGADAIWKIYTILA